MSDENVPVLPVETAYVFPNNLPQLVPAGEEVDMLITFSNKAHVHLNVTSVRGSVNSPLAYAVSLQNFTAAEYDTLIAPGKEATVKYTFKPDAGLIGRTMQLSHVLTYKTGQYMMEKTVFNSTVSFSEPTSGLLDSTGLLLLLQLLSMLSVGGYFGLKELEKRGFIKLSETEAKVVNPGKPEDWLPGSFTAAQDRAADAPKSPKSPAKSKKRN